MSQTHPTTAFETIQVSSRKVACDGGLSQGGLGHPKVYLNMGAADAVTCPYCSITYLYQADGDDSHAHH